METGELAWSRQMTAGDAYTVACVGADRTNCPQAQGPDLDFGSSPVLVDLANGRRALVAGQKSGMVRAIDPDRQGAILWQRRVGRGGALAGVQWGSAVDQDHVYVAVSDLALRLAAEGAARSGMRGRHQTCGTAAPGFRHGPSKTGVTPLWLHPGYNSASGISSRNHVR